MFAGILLFVDIVNIWTNLINGCPCGPRVVNPFMFGRKTDKIWFTDQLTLCLLNMFSLSTRMICYITGLGGLDTPPSKGCTLQFFPQVSEDKSVDKADCIKRSGAMSMQYSDYFSTRFVKKS